jgi:hypothetical protein
MESVFECQAISHEPFVLPTGGVFDVPVYRTRFDAATERIRFENDLYDIKPQLTLDGEVLLAELVIVRRLEGHGWNAVWIDNFKNKHWRELPVHGTPRDLPKDLEALLQRITKLNGRRAGAFDVLAWKDHSIAFLESKGPGDSITETQRTWFTSAVAVGVDREAFGIVEWSYVDPTRATTGELKRRWKERIAMGSERDRKRASAARKPAGATPAAAPTGGSDLLPPTVVRSVIQAGYTLCTAQALDSDGTKYPSRIRGFLASDGRLTAQGRAARDEIRRLGFKLP